MRQISTARALLRGGRTTYTGAIPGAAATVAGTDLQDFANVTLKVL